MNTLPALHNTRTRPTLLRMPAAHLRAHWLTALALLLAHPVYAQSTQAASPAKPAAAAKASMTISTVRPERSSLPLRLAANGNVAAWQEASVGAQSNGLRLQEVRAQVGDRVTQGQVLAVFATDTVEADRAQALAGVAEAEAALAEASANADRARTLQPTGVLSAQQTQQLLTAELTAKARLQSAKATLQQHDLRLQQTRVLAPDSGLISARSATVGAVVGAGVELFRLIRQGRLEWRAEVTSTELERIKPGGSVRISTPSGNEVSGKVRAVAPSVDVQTRNALVYVDIAPGSAGTSGLRAGMYVRGAFDLGSSAALTVPQEAVVLRDGFSYVFKVGADHKVTQQKVQTARRIGNRVEITQGLADDTLLAQTGAGFLNDGDTVRVQTPAQ